MDLLRALRRPFQGPTKLPTFRRKVYQPFARIEQWTILEWTAQKAEDLHVSMKVLTPLFSCRGYQTGATQGWPERNSWGGTSVGMREPWDRAVDRKEWRGFTTLLLKRIRVERRDALRPLHCMQDLIPHAVFFESYPGGPLPLLLPFKGFTLVEHVKKKLSQHLPLSISACHRYSQRRQKNIWNLSKPLERGRCFTSIF